MQGLAIVVKCRRCFHLMFFADQEGIAPLMPTVCPLCGSDNLKRLDNKAEINMVIG